jgi:hypothetical protein
LAWDVFLDAGDFFSAGLAACLADGFLSSFGGTTVLPFSLGEAGGVTGSLIGMVSGWAEVRTYFHYSTREF